MSTALFVFITLHLVAGTVFCGGFFDDIKPPSPNTQIAKDEKLDYDLGDCTVPDVTNGYVYANGVLLAPKAIVLPGTEIRISCFNNTVVVGNGKSTCSLNKKEQDEWQPRLGTCIKHPGCGRLPIVTGGTVDMQGLSHMGATRLIRCYDGYILTGASFVRCKNDMTWSQPGTCLPLPVMAILDVTQCSVPDIANGRLFTSDGQVAPGSILLANTEVRLSCRPGYIVVGNASSICSSWEGKWVPIIGSCVEQIKCGKLPTVVGGLIEDGNWTIGSIRLIRCGENFYLNGRSYIKCLPNATWSQPGYCLYTTTFGAITSSSNRPTMVPFMNDLKKAAQSGNSERMLELIEAGRNVNDVTHPPNTYPHFCKNWNIPDPNPLRLATACNRSVEAVRTILDDTAGNASMKIDDKNSEGFTALMYAADNGNLESVRLLVSRGADVNARNEEGYTPLIYAAWSGHNDTVRFLIQSGANVNAKNRRGYSALILAAHQGYADVVCQLLDHGANINTRNSLGHTAIIYAARFGYSDLVRLLLSRGASVRGCRYQLCKPSGSFEDSRSTEN